jgi:hypothetical protein
MAGADRTRSALHWGYQMRAQRRLALSLLLLAAGLSVLATGTPAQAAPVSGLSLDPSEGRSGTSITASFQVAGVQQGQNCVHTTVTFWWDRTVVGRKDGGCVISVSFRPPKNDKAAGPHQVTARDSRTGQLGAAVFTITGTDATPTGRATATPTATAVASDPPLPTPTEGDTVTVAPPSVDAAAGVTPKSDIGGGSSPLTSFALIVGGLLVLGGIGILGYVVWRTRATGLEPEPAGGLSDYPTQPITLGSPPDPRYTESRYTEPRHAAPSEDPD